jgi:tRNA(Ile)-lysidine synthase
MKRKNLTAKRKAKKNFLPIKDLKVNQLYQKFEKIVKKNINKHDFAVAVSGGADSLCLSYFSKLYGSRFKNKIFILIVNHNIRKESNNEALQVKKILSNKKIKSEVLTWRGKIPKSNIQSNARKFRYLLLSNYCAKKNIKYLITAHHMDDQIENFYIRLLRGSGVSGLSSMAEKVNYNSNLKILRPFLQFKKNELVHTTLAYFGNFIKDPSNNNEKFLRVRIRKFRRDIEKEGVNDSKIVKTINNLLSSNDSINFYKNKALHNYVSFLPKDKCAISLKIFSNESNEIIFKLFSDLISLISKTYYPPRSAKVLNLIKRLKKAKYKKSTLGGCIIEKKEGFVSILKEKK